MARGLLLILIAASACLPREQFPLPPESAEAALFLYPEDVGVTVAYDDEVGPIPVSLDDTVELLWAGYEERTDFTRMGINGTLPMLISGDSRPVLAPDRLCRWEGQEWRCGLETEVARLEERMVLPDWPWEECWAQQGCASLEQGQDVCAPDCVPDVDAPMPPDLPQLPELCGGGRWDGDTTPDCGVSFDACPANEAWTGTDCAPVAPCPGSLPPDLPVDALRISGVAGGPEVDLQGRFDAEPEVVILETPGATYRWPTSGPVPERVVGLCQGVVLLGVDVRADLRLEQLTLEGLVVQGGAQLTLHKVVLDELDAGGAGIEIASSRIGRVTLTDVDLQVAQSAMERVSLFGGTATITDSRLHREPADWRSLTASVTLGLTVERVIADGLVDARGARRLRLRDSVVRSDTIGVEAGAQDSVVERLFIEMESPLIEYSTGLSLLGPGHAMVEDVTIAGTSTFQAVAVHEHRTGSLTRIGFSGARIGLIVLAPVAVSHVSAIDSAEVLRIQRGPEAQEFSIEASLVRARRMTGTAVTVADVSATLFDIDVEGSAQNRDGQVRTAVRFTGDASNTTLERARIIFAGGEGLEVGKLAFAELRHLYVEAGELGLELQSEEPLIIQDTQVRGAKVGVNRGVANHAIERSVIRNCEVPIEYEMGADEVYHRGFNIQEE